MTDILIADDDSTNLFVLSAMLKLCGYETRQAKDGREAVKSAAEKTPQLILMDISMPNLNGIDAARAILATEDGRHIPIMAVTAHATNQTRRDCEAAGFAGFLTKPLSLQELKAAISTVIAT